MKQRFSSLDVKVIAHELSLSLVTLRLANVYDLSSRIFLLKFAKPDDKKQVVIDSGFRCHLTKFSRATAAEPSHFVSRLRKFLKTRRVTSISQVGTDRIVEFQFSDGQYRMFLEFYAAGNIILTDKELKILALLRAVAHSEGQEEQRVGLTYSLENRQNYGSIPPLMKDRLRKALKQAVNTANEIQAEGKRQKKKAADALRKALAVSITEYPPMLIDHAMRVTEFNSALKPDEVLQNEAFLDHLMKSLQEAQRVVQDITSSRASRGYIIAKRANGDLGNMDVKQDESPRQNLIYDDFHPFRPRQFEEDPSCVFLEFDGFNKTVDEFFSSIEGQKLESRLHERELAAKKKLEAAKKDQQKRVGTLQEAQELNFRKAMAIEANVERVQEAIDAVNGLIAQSMDWVEIGKLIELQQKRHNPVAEIIKLPLKLRENTITLLLGEEDFGDDIDSAYRTDSDDPDDESEAPDDAKKSTSDNRLAIDIDLGISPWSNAREYYDQKRSAAVKEQKTLESSSKALKSTERKVAQELKKGLKQEKAVLQPVRQQMWFEKFTWFFSSDGYLVLSGRDAQQSEILYKRYLGKGDVFVHADLHGASSVVIRNKPSTPDAPIPPSTLSQAGTLTVASSSAWDSKAGMSAWWVNADQVSKSALTGEILPIGSFMVCGKKNFLPPAQLLLGFGVLFHISEESKAKHVRHRVRDDVASTDVASTDVALIDVALTDVTSTEAGNALADSLLEAPLDDNDSDDSMLEGDGDMDNGEDRGPTDGQVNPLQSLQGEEACIPLRTQVNSAFDVSKCGETPYTGNVRQSSVHFGEGPATEPEDEESDLNDNGEPGNEEQADSILIVSESASSQSNKGPKPLPRGKRSKAKKIAAKYKDQDEEDRRLVQAITGATLGREKAEAEAKAKAQREAEAAFQKERRRAQHQRTLKETAENEEARKSMLEEGAETHNDEEAERMTDFDAFVGTPLPGDEILEAIPICAPWAALMKCKYKAKLQPGAQKKGRAVKEILTKWVEAAGRGRGAVDEESRDTEKMWPREVELIKNWRPEECTNCVPVSKVRVMMAGGSSGAVPKDSQGKGRGGKGNKGRR